MSNAHALRREPSVLPRAEPAYCTLTMLMTGVIRYPPFPVWITDWLPAKSSVMVVAVVEVTSNSRLRINSPDGTLIGAVRPAGAGIVVAHGALVDGLSK